DESVAGFRWEVDLGGLPQPPAPQSVAAAVSRFRSGAPLPVSKAGKRGERTVDARDTITALEQPGPERLVVEIAVRRDRTLPPSAGGGALLGLDAATPPALRLPKLATPVHTAPGPTAAPVASQPPVA